MPAVSAHFCEDEDYYRILGVTRDVGDEGLKRAYKRQALRWHPDKNQHRSVQAAEKFKKVSEAYQTLSDKQSRAVYNRRRPSAGSNEVLFSKTYGWPGVNISFYWTGPPPNPESEDPEAEATESPMGPSQARPKAKKHSDEREKAADKSPLELFADMFEMKSPLATIDKQLDGMRRQSSIFESVFGSFASFEQPKDDVTSEPQPTQEEHQRPWNKARCAATMKEKDKRLAHIQEEYRRGAINEEEYKEMLALFSAP